MDIARYLRETFVQNRFNHLLIAIISLFIIEPLYEATGWQFPLIGFLFSGVLLLALRVSTRNLKIFRIFAAVCIAGISLWILASYDTLPFGFDEAMYSIGILIVLIIFAYPIYAIGRQILEAQEVTVDMIKGAICLYMLIGMLWSIFYTAIFHFDPHAFNFTAEHPDSFMYYSYTVLTTTGFGDITPVNNFAANLTTLEAITGQMFLTVFVARLVGIHIAVKMEKKNI